MKTFSLIAPDVFTSSGVLRADVTPHGQMENLVLEMWTPVTLAGTLSNLVSIRIKPLPGESEKAWKLSATECARLIACGGFTGTARKDPEPGGVTSLPALPVWSIDINQQKGPSMPTKKAAVRKKYKVTYFSADKQKNVKKDLDSLSEVKAFVKNKALVTYGVWELLPRYSKAG